MRIKINNIILLNFNGRQKILETLLVETLFKIRAQEDTIARIIQISKRTKPIKFCRHERIIKYTTLF